MNNILFILIDYRNTIKDIMWYRIDFDIASNDWRYYVIFYINNIQLRTQKNIYNFKYLYYQLNKLL